MNKTFRSWLLMGMLGVGGMLAIGTTTAQAAHRGHHRGGHHARSYKHSGRNYNNFGRYNHGVRRFGYGGFNGYSVAPYGTYNNYGFLGNGLYPGLGSYRGYGLRRYW